MHALLDLMRENKAAVQDMSDQYQTFLHSASVRLKILHPENGEKELIELVADLSLLGRSASLAR